MTKLTQEDESASLKSNLLANEIFSNEQECYLLLYSSFHTPEHLDYSPPPGVLRYSRFLCFYDMDRLNVSYEWLGRRTVISKVLKKRK